MPSRFDGSPTEVLVLGTAHLNHETTDTALALTLHRLEAWRPQAMAVELLPGEVIQGYRLEGPSYKDLRLGGYTTALRLEAEAKRYRSWTRSEAEAVALRGDTPSAERVLAWLVEVIQKMVTVGRAMR